MKTRQSLADDIRALGLESGDTALVRAAVKAIGEVEGRASDVVLDALLDVVGPDGTIVGLAHTAAQSRSHTENVFRRDTPAVTGGFVAAMLARPTAVRSAHPTNSMVAIGRHAATLLEGHDHRSTCFAPIRRLIDAGGKMLLIGCTRSSPGFSTVHLAYEELGLARKSLMTGLEGAYYVQEGRPTWFSKGDVPGCSRGFGRFYPSYKEAGVLREGLVGDAASMLIGARDAYRIELPAVRADPTVSLCDDPDCLSCRGTKLFNLREFPRFYAHRPRMLAGLLLAQTRRLIRGG